MSFALWQRFGADVLMSLLVEPKPTRKFKLSSKLGYRLHQVDILHVWHGAREKTEALSDLTRQFRLWRD